MVIGIKDDSNTDHWGRGDYNKNGRYILYIYIYIHMYVKKSYFVQEMV